MRNAKSLLLASILTATIAAPAGAAMSRGAPEGDGPPPEKVDSAYGEAEIAARAGECERALRLLRTVLSRDPTDADAHSLRGYCRRKTGDLEGAFQSYENALKLRPRFPQAREYLAEAYVDAALEQVRILREYGADGEEELREVARALRRAAGRVGTLIGDGGDAKRDAW